jgi:hypothetical protein
MRERIGNIMWKIMVGCATGQMGPDEKDRATSDILSIVEEEMAKERTEFKNTLNEIRRINAETLTRLGRIAELKSKLKEEG